MEKKATISIEGMSCEHCVRAVKEAVGAQSGVKSVDVSLEEKNAQVVYDDEKYRTGAESRSGNL